MKQADDGQRILAAAIDVFEREGFHTASMATVAAAAGVSKGLPYHYFENKEALARAVVAEHLDAVLTEIRRWDGTTPESRLAWYVERALAHAASRAPSYRLFLSLAMQPATRGLALAEVASRQEQLSRIDEELSRIFKELGHPEPETEALVVRATVDGLVLYLLMTGEAFPIDEAVRRVVAQHGRRGGQ
jgi:AcrR family transcriptional regulator